MALEVETERLKKAVAEKRKLLKEMERLEVEEGQLLEDGEIPQDAEVVPGSGRIEKILGELQGEGTFDVYRLDVSGKQVKLATYDVGLYPAALEKLVAAKGGGDYILTFRNPDGSYAGQVTRTFDGASYTPAAGGMSDTSLKFMEMMQASEARHQASLEALRMENQRMMLEQQKMMLEMVKAQGSSAEASLEKLAKLKGLFSEERPDMISQFLQFKDLMDEMRGEVGEEKESPIVKIVSKISEALASKLPVPAASPSNMIPQRQDAPEPSFLEPYAGAIEQAIRSGASPIKSAETTIEHLKSNDLIAEVLADLPRLSDAGEWRKLMSSHPFIGANASWVDQFSRRLLVLLRENATSKNHVEPVAVSGTSNQD